MIRGIYSAARGMALQVKQQEVISNNLANSNTAGFKKDAVLVQSFSDQLLTLTRGKSAAIGPVAQSPVIESIITDFSPGTMEQTGRSLDMALMGQTAFFVVQTPDGVRYTRDGSFSLDGDGFLVTSDGYYVLDTENRPLQLQSEAVVVDKDGGIRAEGEQANQLLGRLAIAVFAPGDLAGLQKRGQNLFAATDVEPVGQGQGEVRQGELERANLDIVREMVDMLAVMRVYEANQKALQAHDEMLGKSVNEVGRLG